MDFFQRSSPVPGRLTLLAACFVITLCALLVTVGADADWLVALGGHIAHSGAIPDGVPFAAVSSAGWHNVPVLGELTFYAIQAVFGSRGLVIAQLAGVAVCLLLITLDLRRAEVSDLPAALVVAMTSFAAASAFLIVRAQLFSLALFPLLLLLVRAEVRHPSRRVWLLVPLVVLWSNLHGGVLLGVFVAGVYLVLVRGRKEPLVSAGVLAGMFLALFATPAFLETAAYYVSVLGSRAAQHREGMWAPLSLHAPFDVIFLFAAVPLVVLAMRSRLAIWEWCVIAVLGASAVRSSRNEVWLALFVAMPAARGLAASRLRWADVPSEIARVVTALLVVVAIVVAFARTSLSSGASPWLLDAAGKAAGGAPILADDVNAEQLALAGRRILIGNPLDAFPQGEQQLYLDWLAGRPEGDTEPGRVRAVLVIKGSQAHNRLAARGDFREVGRDEHDVLYVRRSATETSRTPGRSVSAGPREYR